MSDRQKGLIEALKELVPVCKHRFCLRHMYANLKKKFKQPELKGAFWKAASCSNKQDFEEEIKSIEKVDPMMSRRQLSDLGRSLMSIGVGLISVVTRSVEEQGEASCATTHPHHSNPTLEKQSAQGENSHVYQQRRNAARSGKQHATEGGNNEGGNNKSVPAQKSKRNKKMTEDKVVEKIKEMARKRKDA